MLGSGFRLYLAYDTVTDPRAIDTLVNADGTEVTAGTSINDLATGSLLKLADEIKDVTEAGNPNTINTTTRRVARQGVQANEITTVSRDLSVQFVYEPRATFAAATAGYEVLDLLEYCDESKSPIYVIDLDKALGTDGAKGGGANYTVSLSQPREVEGQTVYDATFAVKSFYQRVTYDLANVLFKAKADP